MPLPPGQQLVARNKWPIIGEREPADDKQAWPIEVTGLVERAQAFSPDDLRQLPQQTSTVDIHCVTRWSRPAVEFSGVLLSELLKVVIPRPDAKFVSFVAHSARQHSTSLPLGAALELGTLLAWQAEGRPLPPEHGGPVRVVVPGRYFYKSLKWLARIELLAEDRLGFWEATAGYHNEADPWREQRYMAPALDKHALQQALAARDFSGRDLRSLSAAGHALAGLTARQALLRDADFRRANLRQADFTAANLSNAHLEAADLQQASFRDADCEGTDFSAADLRGADFSGASLFGATFHAEHDGLLLPGQAAQLNAATRFDHAAFEQLTPLQSQALRQLVDAARNM